jgi:hypothetical protein
MASNIDEFATQIFEEAKRFLEKFDEEPEVGAYLHASISLGFISFEAHINAIAEEFLIRPELTALERSILAERDIEFSDGEFGLSKRLKMHRLDDRLLFLCKRFSKKPIDRTSALWANLKNAIKLRNELTHPKGPIHIQRNDVAGALQALLDMLDYTYRALYKQTYPGKFLGLQSKLEF